MTDHARPAGILYQAPVFVDLSLPRDGRHIEHTPPGYRWSGFHVSRELWGKLFSNAKRWDGRV